VTASCIFLSVSHGAADTPRDTKLAIASERRLSHLDSSVIGASLVSSPDARHIAYVAHVGVKECAMIDSNKEHCFEAIGTLIPEPFGEQTYLGGPTFSPDSRKFAYQARENAKWFVVANGERQNSYDDIHPRSLVFSPNGERLAYVVGSGLEQAVVVDGKQEKTYDSISSITFSPDSQRLAYWAGFGQWRVVVTNGRQGKPYQERGISYLGGGKLWVSAEFRGLAFSPDSKHLAYSAISGPWDKMIEGKWLTHNENTFAVVDGREQRNRYIEIYDGPIFSPDSQRQMYTARGEPPSPPLLDYSVVVVNEVEQEHYDDVEFGTLHFSPDSKRFAYVARAANHWFVVADGKAEKPYDAIRMSFDSSWCFDGVRNCSSSVEPRGPTFSPDSQRMAYGAQLGGKWFVLVDGKAEGPYEGIVGNILFSPDSKFVAYSAKIGEKYVVVADGKKGNAFDGLVNGEIVFDTDDTFHYLGVKKSRRWVWGTGRDIYLIQQTVQ
jgi:hypothetical protein